MLRIAIIVLGLGVVVGFFVWRFGGDLLKINQPLPLSKDSARLIYWGFPEDAPLINSLVAEYQKDNPNVSITFVPQTAINYRTRVMNQINQGGGPDIFEIHNSWLLMIDRFLAPAPRGVLSLDEYKNLYYGVILQSFTKNNNVYAVPIDIDGLGLYYNEDILQAAGVKPPHTWQEFIDASVKLTVKQKEGYKIINAGAALGTASNVDHWPDILGLLLLQQPRVDIRTPYSPDAVEVVRFYTNFVLEPKFKTWDISLPSSTQAFETGQVAFYFAPFWRVKEIREANPNLRFKVIPLPQLPCIQSVCSQVGWGTFWGEAVSVKSSHQKEAWRFLKFLTTKKGQTAAFNKYKEINGFGMPYARMDMAGDIMKDPVLGAFVSQAPYYKFWYMSSNTQDSGLNDNIIQLWEDAINGITTSRKDIDSSLKTMPADIAKIFAKYFQSP